MFFFQTKEIEERVLMSSWSIFAAMPHCSSRFHEDGVIVIPSFVLIQVFLFHHKFILHVSLLLFFTDFYGFLVLKFCPSIIVIVIGVSNCL